MACWICGSPSTNATTNATAPATPPASSPRTSSGPTALVASVAGAGEQVPWVVQELVDRAPRDQRQRPLLGPAEVEEDHQREAGQHGVRQQLTRRGDRGGGVTRCGVGS